ncbi:MAG: hypothetical protein ACM3PT_02710 [Deltaproteobacteria bacterium]
MKKSLIFLSVFTIIFSFSACKVQKSGPEKIIYSNINDVKSTRMSFELLKGKSFNHPSYVIWMEDNCGKYYKTLFITKSYASGIFGHQMVGDTVWLRTSGASYQPAALPYWTFRKGLINGKTYIPEPANPYIDAYTGATPKSDFRFETGTENSIDGYRILLEVNQAWDWNQYWTNNKYPDNNAYKHSAQPSLVYEVTINDQDNEFHLNPIGHGDPKGETGKLFTNLATLTSAKDIFSKIKIEIIK